MPDALPDALPAALPPALLHTDLPFRKYAGKVRDVYDVSGELSCESLLIVATDRISAFDVVMPNGIPDKGKLLTAMSVFWFDHFLGRFDTHLITDDLEILPHQVARPARHLAGRSMLVMKTTPLPVECVVRGYLTGGGWREYQAGGSVSGVKLPPGLQQCQKLPEPIFTPSTKAKEGHDEPISFERVVELVGQDTATQLREKALAVYTEAAAYALERGIIIADTKFEFGLDDQGRLIVIDEMLTPDSSRFWPADGYAPGREQPSFDKEFVRAHLAGLEWDRTPPGPVLPLAVVAGTRRRYVEAYERLTGKRFEG